MSFCAMIKIMGHRCCVITQLAVCIYLKYINFVSIFHGIFVAMVQTHKGYQKSNIIGLLRPNVHSLFTTYFFPEIFNFAKSKGGEK